VATIQKDTLGVLDIELIQNAAKEIRLVFTSPDFDNPETQVPLDLRTFEPIRLDVKARKNVNERPFISFTVGRGLAIDGEDFNQLVFGFENEFTNADQTEWFYDLKVTTPAGPQYWIEGVIRITKSVTK
jgi:hypothetical protein